MVQQIPLMGHNGCSIMRDGKDGFALVTKGNHVFLGTNIDAVIEKLKEHNRLNDFELDDLKNYIDNK